VAKIWPFSKMAIFGHFYKIYKTYKVVYKMIYKHITYNFYIKVISYTCYV